MKRPLLIATGIAIGISVTLSISSLSAHDEDVIAVALKKLLRQNELQIRQNDELKAKMERLQKQFNDFVEKWEAEEAPWAAGLWNECWNGEYVDFTTSRWTQLPTSLQRRLAGEYQKWYATKIKQPMEKDVYAGGTTIRVVLIPPGKFWMGSPEGEKDRESNEKHHAVLISKHYYIGKYEVTQQQWQAVMGDDPAYFKGERNPVEQVNWDECDKFCRELGGQLPTEAQWEYACRAGTTRPFNLGDDIDTERVNYNGNNPYRGNKGVYREKTVAAGSLANENSWGCYDFHGNVSEWCSDYKSEYIVGVDNPTGSDSGSSRVLRGGNWYYEAEKLRSAARDSGSPGTRFHYAGFRFCKSD